MTGTTAEATPAALRALWGDPELATLWAAARRRLERNGCVLGGRPVVLRDPPLATRDRVAALLGELRRPTGDVPVSLARLDAALRTSRFGLGLLEVLEALDGRPVTDRRAERAAARDSLQAARRELAAHPALRDHPELTAWVDGLDARGLFGPAPGLPPARLALDVLALLPADGVNRAELAHRVAGDAHALDDDAPLGRLVLAGIANLLRTGAPPGDASARRALWEAAGVVSNPLTCHALVLNLPLAGNGRIARRLRESAAEGMSERLLLSQLRAEPLDATPLAGRIVWVCENPVVTERAEAALGSTASPLICVEGWMNSAVARLLSAIHDAGAQLAYHGDFDWSGVRIAASIIGRLPACPWRFRAADYLAAVEASPNRLPPLEGYPSPTPWDPALTEAMTRSGLVVEEEAVLADLLTDLAS
ncbi:MAG TPA: TIGR02679 family protein [Actinomycetota bacterium]|nr:TIGR02679 family protein [Actinomycetota bacterium]